MKSKIIKITAFLLLVIVGCFITFHFSNKEKVKADTPTLYYFDVNSQSFDSYCQIILYVHDAVALVNDTTNYHFEGYNNSPPFRSVQSASTNCQFLRYTQLDHDDYDAYITNITYQPSTSYHWQQIVIYTNNLSITGESIAYSLYLPYYPTFKAYYDKGHDEGYDAGYQDGTNDRNAYWENYIEETYESTTGRGYQRIFEAGRTKGYRQGQESIDTTDWLQTVATDVGSILNIKLMPFITIGGLIFIPLMFTILGAILWIWRKK